MIFKNGLSFKNSYLILKVKKNGLDESRFGFVISRKVSKKAVMRNKIKRRLSEIIRLRLKEIKIGLDLVLISLPGAEKKNFFEIEESLLGLLERAKIISKEQNKKQKNV